MTSFYELIEMYPAAVPAARRNIKACIKITKQQISSLSTFRDAWTKDINKMHFKQQPAMILWLDERVAEYDKEYQKELRTYQYQLQYLDNLGKPATNVTTQDKITPDRVARAKEYPITELVDVKRGVFCLCPFHDDHNPSMHIYRDNHAYCYSCNKRADAIDMWMKIRGVEFPEAVRAMAP